MASDKDVFDEAGRGVKSIFRTQLYTISLPIQAPKLLDLGRGRDRKVERGSGGRARGEHVGG
jgi:hypothetical protein